MGTNNEDRRLFFERFQLSRLAILTDDADPNGRALLVAPASQATPEEVNRILTLSGGHLFVALSPARVNAFLLPRMSRPKTAVPAATHNDSSLDMCVSVEAREGVTTGISAFDRAQTIAILGEAVPSPRKLVKPGHIFPVQIRDGGVLVRNTLPEGAIDIVKEAGFTDAAIFVDLLSPDGSFLGPAEQESLAKREDLPRISISDLIRHLLETKRHVEKIAEAKLPTGVADDLRALLFRSAIHNSEHLVLIKGEITTEEPVLTRVQTESTFSDVFGGTVSTRAMLRDSLAAIEKKGRGVLIYLRRPVEGQLAEQVISSAGRIREKPATMVREYGLGAQILRELGVKRIELITNSRKNLVGLTTFGIDIVSQIPLSTSSEVP